MRFAIYLASTAIVFHGCSKSLADPQISFEPPPYVEQLPEKEEENIFVSKGSIFGQGDNPLFSDHKAMHINDIVTVVINEQTSSSSKASKSLKKNDKIGLGGGAFVSGGDNTILNTAVDKLNSVSNIGFSAGSDSTFSGTGSADKKATFSTTVSSRIVKVLNNGNYFIAGRREIMVDNQKQIIQISGVIRPYDIDQNNQINSSKISDAKIMYANEGDIDGATNQGWGSKLVRAVWPF